MESNELMLAAADLAVQFDDRLGGLIPGFREVSSEQKAEFYKLYLCAIGGMMCAHLGHKEACTALQFVQGRISGMGLPAHNEIKP